LADSWKQIAHQNTEGTWGRVVYGDFTPAYKQLSTRWHDMAA